LHDDIVRGGDEEAHLARQVVADGVDRRCDDSGRKVPAADDGNRRDEASVPSRHDRHDLRRSDGAPVREEEGEVPERPVVDGIHAELVEDDGPCVNT